MRILTPVNKSSAPHKFILAGTHRPPKPSTGLLLNCFQVAVYEQSPRLGTESARLGCASCWNRASVSSLIRCRIPNPGEGRVGGPTAPAAILAYSGFSSMPRNRRPVSLAMRAGWDRLCGPITSVAGAFAQSEEGGIARCSKRDGISLTFVVDGPSERYLPRPARTTGISRPTGSVPTVATTATWPARLESGFRRP